MYKEYISLYHTYTQKYGKKTAIFLMVGSFYELYDIQNINTGETEGNIIEIVDILGIQLSTKKEEAHPEHKCLFAGFPDYVMHKWAGRLTSIGWTVVIVDQQKDHRGKVIERKVSRILSPSTHIENTSSNEIPYIMNIYFNQSDLSYGVSVLDLTTGSTITYTGMAIGHCEIWTADELVQMIHVYPPKEVLLYWNGNQVPEQLHRIIGLSQEIPLHIRKVESTIFSSDLIRYEYLQRIYGIQSLLPVKTYLGLRSDNEELSLVYLLQFVEDHYPTIITKFHCNMPWIPHTRLICGNHALLQLQIDSHSSPHTILQMINKCITSMGKRGIRNRIVSPYSDETEIQKRLLEVEEYMRWSIKDNKKEIEKQLRFVLDISRLHRRLLCGLICPEEIIGLFQSYQAMDRIASITKDTILEKTYNDIEWKEYESIFRKHFTENKIQSRTLFNIETYPEIGLKENEMRQIIEDIHQLRSRIALEGGVNEEAIRLEEREKDGYGLKGSTLVLHQLKKNITKLPKGIKISELKSGGWIECIELQEYNNKLQLCKNELDKLVNIYLVEACYDISNKGRMLWVLMETWITHIDCTQCIARVSKENGWVCPVIETVDEKGSSVEIEQMRHPLVEMSSSRVSYVKHNIKLDEETNGWLVYGMNASGKSTLMKALGICILLAQAGCFVPAKKMILRPFRAIYTRILNQDNLVAGLSSFAVEMSELRDILSHANKYTLVLGDELCSGTESTSALALVASGMEWLLKANAKFVFATHLHDLSSLIQNEKIKIWHLHVDYDPVSKKLVYERTLKPGNGSTLYGLEVARAMNLPFEYMEKALEYRERIIGIKKIEQSKKSQWNKDIIYQYCEICKSKIVNDLEVHHIEPRASAVNNILSDGTHMNHKSNLITICGKCHDEIHSGKKEVGKMKMTSVGPEREINEVISVKKSKWSVDEMNMIKNVLKMYVSLSLKSIRAHLYSKYGIEISESVLGKIKRE